MTYRRQIVNRLGAGRFRVRTADVLASSLTLDFSKIIRYYHLSGAFCLVHWQAKPKYQRRWGVYDSQQDWYYTATDLILQPSQQLGIQGFQISESQFSTVPTSVLMVPEASVQRKGETLYVG